jgi:hypothetical protein
VLKSRPRKPYQAYVSEEMDGTVSDTEDVAGDDFSAEDLQDELLVARQAAEVSASAVQDDFNLSDETEDARVDAVLKLLCGASRLSTVKNAPDIHGVGECRVLDVEYIALQQVHVAGTVPHAEIVDDQACFDNLQDEVSSDTVADNVHTPNHKTSTILHRIAYRGTSSRSRTYSPSRKRSTYHHLPNSKHTVSFKCHALCWLGSNLKGRMSSL